MPGRVLGAVVFGILSVVFASTAGERPAWTSNRVVGSPNPPAPYRTERVHAAQKYPNAVDLARMPGTDRWTVAENAGKIWTFRKSEDDGTRRDLLIDVKALRPAASDVLGFAFHPGFVTNRYLFLNYNEAGGRPTGSKIIRFTVPPQDPPAVDPASGKVILEWTSGGHNGCTLSFGVDGTLFISTGDGASPDPPDGAFQTGQDLSDLLASILRIDVDHPAPGQAYSIPRDNPFRDTPSARPEIWAYGLRNPFRMSVDPATGDLWVGDVGWEQWEMIYRVTPGANFGWPLTEGPNRQVRTDLKQGPGPIVPPMVALAHSEAASITGGRVYHGKRLAELRGAYIFGDWETGKFWALRQQDGRLVSNRELCDTTLKPVAFAEDDDGELVILDYGGGLHRLVPNEAPPANEAFPRRLRETGLFTDLPSLVPSPGVVAYEPRAGMWSDHAKVERVVGVPGRERIATADGRETIVGRMWYFPSNTVFARTLSLGMSAGVGSAPRRVETQLLHFDGQGWNAYSYRWNDAQTDAELVPAEGVQAVVEVPDATAPGGRQEVPWRFLSRAECFRCHNAWAGDLLSFQWNQLGHPDRASEAARLRDLGVLKVSGPVGNDPVLVSPSDVSAPLAERARSWLHVNCSGCHRFGAGGGVNLHLDAGKPLTECRAVDEKPSRGDFGLVDARILAPGDPYRSALFYRINTEGSARMPHIGSHLVDLDGARLIGEWIRSLPRSPGSSDAAGVDLAKDVQRWLGELDGSGRGDAVERLLGSLNGALALLGRVDAVKPGDPSGMTLRTMAATAGKNHSNPMVRDLYQRLLPPGERRKTLGADVRPASILDLTGDVLRGREVFGGVAQCVRCHTREGNGRAFGPDLTGIARRLSRAQVLENILQPSKVIAPEFKTTTLVMKDETELSGFILGRTPSSVTLKDAMAVERTVPVASIAETRVSDLSAMPEGMLSGLTAQEAADLLAYLMSVTP